MPKVSIVIPTYNQANLLSKALDCVRAQTEMDWEAIIINNYSDDNTIETVEAYAEARFRLINFENHGVIGAARNIGIKYSK